MHFTCIKTSETECTGLDLSNLFDAMMYVFGTARLNNQTGNAETGHDIQQECTTTGCQK